MGFGEDDRGGGGYKKTKIGVTSFVNGPVSYHILPFFAVDRLTKHMGKAKIQF